MLHPIPSALAALTVGTSSLLASLALSGGAASHTPACTSFGATWARGYNSAAAKSGNPIRIVSACCHPGTRFGVNTCLLTVTLAGTRDRGCELVDIGSKGLPVGPGKHESCKALT